MSKTANHEQWGDFRIGKRRSFFALAHAVVAAAVFFLFWWHWDNGHTLAMAILAAALYELSVDKLFKRCASVPVDEPAWEEFFRRYEHDIRAAICRVIGFSSQGRFGHLLADILQRVNLRLLENDRRALLSFRGKTDPEARAFLRKVAATVAINIVNQENIIHPTPSQQTKNSSGQNGETIDLTAQNEDYFLLLDTLEHYLKELLRGKNKSRNMLIFKLAVVDGLSPKEIAEIPGLGLSSSHAVEQQITRIRRKLRDYLQNQ